MCKDLSLSQPPRLNHVLCICTIPGEPTHFTLASKMDSTVTVTVTGNGNRHTNASAVVPSTGADCQSGASPCRDRNHSPRDCKTFSDNSNTSPAQPIISAPQCRFHRICQSSRTASSPEALQTNTIFTPDTRTPLLQSCLKVKHWSAKSFCISRLNSLSGCEDSLFGSSFLSWSLTPVNQQSTTPKGQGKCRC